MSDGEAPPTGSSSSRRVERRADVLWALALVVALVGYWFLRVVPEAVPRPGLIGDDLLFQFFPDHVYLAERLRAGALPLWNPHQGQPFLATLLPGALYPARALLLVLDVPTAMHVSTVVHLALGAVATYALGRALDVTRLGAVAGAATFTGVFALPNVYTPAFLEGGVWLPVAGLALVRLVATGAWGWAIALGATAGLPVLAGCYQHTLYAAYGLAVLAVGLAVDPVRRGLLGRPGMTARLAAALGVALATAAPQLLPTLAWSAETVRSGRLADAQLDAFPFPLRALRHIFLPPPDYASAYVSIPVAILVLVGGVRGRRFERVVLAATTVAVLLVVGRGTPAFGLFRVLPGFAWFRSPERIAFLVAFLAAIGVGLGTSRLGRRPWVAAAALASVVTALFTPSRAPVAFPWTSPPEFLTGPPALMHAIEANAGGARVLLPGGATADGLAVKHATIHHVRGLQDYNPLSSRRLGAYLRAVVGEPPLRPDAGLFLGWLPMNRQIARPELLDAMSVRLLLLRPWVRFSAGRPAPRPILTQGRWTLFENPAALPRAFAVGHARLVADEDAALATMALADFDLRHEVALVAGAADVAALEDGPRKPLREAGVVLDEPEHVVLDVDVDRPSVVVLADPFAPGWSATANGRPATVHVANALARGVVVPAGRTRVELTYHAPGLRLGAAIAGVGWAATLLVVALGWWRSRVA